MRARQRFLTVLLCILVSSGCNRVQEGRKASEHLADIVADLRSVPPPVNSTLITEDRYSKFGLASAQAAYQSTLTSKEVAAYYDSVLVSRGWRLARAAAVPDAAGFLSRTYCRDGIEANLHYVRPNAQPTFYITRLWTINTSPCHKRH